jgi:putative oxidoreductase
MGMTAFLDKLHPVAINAWRIIIGFTYFTHGGQKLFAWFGGNGVDSIASLFGAAGFFEFFGGIAIIVGLRTRFVAFVLSGQMAVAYWYQHVGNGGLWHWENGGELAAVYCLTFLLMSTIGGGDFSIDGLLGKRTAPA